MLTRTEAVSLHISLMASLVFEAEERDKEISTGMVDLRACETIF